MELWYCAAGFQSGCWQLRKKMLSKSSLGLKVFQNYFFQSFIKMILSRHLDCRYPANSVHGGGEYFYANDPPYKASGWVHFFAARAILIVLLQKHKCPQWRASAGGSWTEFISRAGSFIWVQMLSTCKLPSAFFPPTWYTSILLLFCPAFFTEENMLQN